MKVYGFAKNERWLSIRGKAIKMRKQGYSLKQISNALGKGYEYIKKCLSIEGYRNSDSCHVWNDMRQKELENNILIYDNLEAVAQAMGKSPDSIRNRMYQTIGTISFKKARKFIKGE